MFNTVQKNKPAARTVANFAQRSAQPLQRGAVVDEAIAQWTSEAPWTDQQNNSCYNCKCKVHQFDCVEFIS